MINRNYFKNGELAWEKKKYPSIIDDSGCLGVIEVGEQLDFNIKRVFYLLDIEKNAERGLHAHKDLKQIILCLKGSFTLTLNDGFIKESIEMRQDNYCIYVDGKVWREMKMFSEDAVMLVLCDREYQFDEVIRDYSEFKKNLPRIDNGL